MGEADTKVQTEHKGFASGTVPVTCVERSIPIEVSSLRPSRDVFLGHQVRRCILAPVINFCRNLCGLRAAEGIEGGNRELNCQMARLSGTSEGGEPWARGGGPGHGTEE
jgi:hypothetical protein